MSVRVRHRAGDRRPGTNSIIRGDRNPIRGRRAARVGMEKGAQHMTSSKVENTASQGTEAPEEGYERGLGSRQVQMIAIGGAIGVGLFLGAGANIAKAGPSLILMYALAG